MFTSDLLFNYVQPSKALAHSKYKIAAFCNYMGGVPRNADEIFPKSVECKVPTLIITGDLDENAPRCAHAHTLYQELQVPCEMQIIPKQKHEFLSSKTLEIFNFLVKY